MKKNMLLALWLPLIAITIFTACKKTVTSGSYEVRQYGAYQFGASIDGVEFVPKGDGFAIQYPISAQLVNRGAENDWYFSAIIADDGNFLQPGISVYVKNFTGVGKYSLNKTTTSYPPGRPDSYGSFSITPLIIGGVNQRYMTNSIDTGYLECTQYDGMKKIFNYSFVAREIQSTTLTKKIEGTISY